MISLIPSYLPTHPPTQVTSKNILEIEYILLQQNFYLLCKKSVQVQPRYLSVCDYSPRGADLDWVGGGGGGGAFVKYLTSFQKHKPVSATKVSYLNMLGAS